MERVRPGKREAHPAITEFNQEDFEMFFRLVRRPETSVWPQPPSQRSPQFPVASCLVKIHSSQVKTGFLRAHGPSESATSECKRGCGRTMYFKICGVELGKKEEVAFQQEAEVSLRDSRAQLEANGGSHGTLISKGW